MSIYKEVSWMFLFCSILVAGGELHRTFGQPNPPETSDKPIESPSSASMVTSNAIAPLPIPKIPLLFPVPGHSRKHLIGKFGEPRGNGTRKHEGIDISAKKGTPVVAVVEGIVVKVKEGGNGGKQVWMKDKNRDWTYYYAHLNSQSVVVGQEVKQGDELGTVGSTGNAPKNCPHLHFSIYEPGMKALDPLVALP